MAIATVTNYSTIFNITPTVSEQAVISSNLDYSTALINNYCHRNIEQATYTEWIDNSYTSDKEYVYTQEYPINKIYYIGIPSTCAKIQNTNVSATISSISYDSNVFSLYWMDILGNDNQVELLASNNKILSTLKTNIEANSGWYCNVESDYVSFPVSFLSKLDIAQVQDNEVDIKIADNNDISGQVDIVDEDCIRLNQGFDRIFVKYLAGYTAATMPKELIYVCCQIASDLQSFASGGSIDENSGVVSNLIQSEHISDYSYSKFSNATREEIVVKYDPILSKYTKKSFIQ